MEVSQVKTIIHQVLGGRGQVRIIWRGFIFDLKASAGPGLV